MCIELYKYNWKHIPSGKTGTRERMFVSCRDFYESISKWNKQGDGVWIYWT